MIRRLAILLTLATASLAAAQTTRPTLDSVSRRLDAIDAHAALLDAIRAGTAVIDARHRAVSPLHAGCVAGQCDDQGWQQMSAGDYSAWIKRTASPLWIIDDEPTLDAAGIAALNARTPARAAQVRAASPTTLVGLYGPVGGDYWPYVNGDDPNFAPARAAIVARGDALLPALAACDVLVGGVYPYYSEDPASEHNDTRSFPDPAAERLRRDRAYIAGTVAELRRLSAKLGGKPIAVMAWGVDHETLKPLSPARADAFVDAILAEHVTLILWGDKTPDGGIGERMLARAVRR